MIKLLLFFIVFLMALSGCAITGKAVYKENLQLVNFSDGINEEEAVIIAQNYLINNNLTKDCNIYRVGDAFKIKLRSVPKFNLGCVPDV